MGEPVRKLPADRNMEVRLRVMRHLERLLNEAVDPDFRGTVGVEIPSKAGRLGEPKFIRVQFAPKD